MFKLSKGLKPVNRYITIIPHFPSKQETAVLLPDDYNKDDNRYITATVMGVASDCATDLRKLQPGYDVENSRIIVDKSMIEEITIGDKKHHLVLENYVLGILRGLDED